MSSEQHWGYGVYVEPTTMRITGSLTEDEYRTYSEAIGNVRRLGYRFAVKLIERNHHEYRNLRRFSGILIAMGRQPFTIDRLNAGELLMGQVVNWLTSVRLYLDHTETDLKRRFGEQSPQVVRFKEATAAAYDESFAYRFLYKLRNYVQHCGLPLANISISAPTKSTNRFAIQRVRFQVDPVKLLQTYSGWGTVATDLRALVDPFELDDLIDEAMNRLRLIENVRMILDIEAAASTAGALEELLTRIGEEDGLPAIYGFTTPQAPEEIVETITPTHFDRSAVTTLVAVANGERGADSIMEAPESPPPLPLDPTTLRQTVAADSRGVQAVLSWIAQGGGNAEFINLVNKITDEDQGIGPLIEGLVKVAVVMGHLAGAVLGTSAEGVIAGMMEVYSQFDQEE